jgi:hypothetical protein
VDLEIEKFGRKEMNINKTRGLLYKLAKFLGDLSAIFKGKPGKRITRRATGKATGKLLRKLIK